MFYRNACGLISELEISTRKESEGHCTRLTLKNRFLGCLSFQPLHPGLNQMIVYSSYFLIFFRAVPAAKNVC